MSYTRSRGGGSYTSRTKTREQEPVELEEGVPKCSGHNRRCKEFVAGPKTKNPGRKFYTCPLGQSDPQRCNFFKWADDSPSTTTISGGEKLGGAAAVLERVNERYGSVNGGGQTLGQSPQGRYGRPTTMTTPTASRMRAPITPVSNSKSSAFGIAHKTVEMEEGDEIDWDRVDTDSLERDAIASTPGSSQRQTKTGSAENGPESTTLDERLRSVADETPSRVQDSLSKRKREDEVDVDKTPKRPLLDSNDNPFLSSPGGIATPVHPALTPSLSNFEELSAHLHRQDRLIRAGEVAKEGFRKTIQRQKEQIEQLEKRIKELEGK